MTVGYKFDLLQTAINRGIRDSIIRDGIASGEFASEKPPSSFLEPSHSKENSFSKALVGAAAVAVGGLLINWLTSSPQPPAEGKTDTAGRSSPRESQIVRKSELT
jgi:hypothetical protein